MLAAVSGLAFTLSTLLGLETYIGYLLPMPVIVAAMRSGASGGRKTMTATCFLLLRKSFGTTNKSPVFAVHTLH